MSREAAVEFAPVPESGQYDNVVLDLYTDAVVAYPNPVEVATRAQPTDSRYL